MDKKIKLFKRKHLNTLKLSQFRKEAKEHYQVWRKNGKYYVAIDVVASGGKLYADETVPFGDDISGAKKLCDKYRYDYMTGLVKRYKADKIVY